MIIIIAEFEYLYLVEQSDDVVVFPLDLVLFIGEFVLANLDQDGERSGQEIII